MAYSFCSKEGKTYGLKLKTENVTSIPKALMLHLGHFPMLALSYLLMKSRKAPYQCSEL